MVLNWSNEKKLLRLLTYNTPDISVNFQSFISWLNIEKVQVEISASAEPSSTEFIFKLK